MAEIDGMTPAPSRHAYLRSPEGLLLLMATAMPLSFATWQALLNNFVIERAAFTGAEIGILQSLREVPGFLAFTVVFALFAYPRAVPGAAVHRSARNRHGGDRRLPDRTRPLRDHRRDVDRLPLQ